MIPPGPAGKAHAFAQAWQATDAGFAYLTAIVMTIGLAAGLGVVLWLFSDVRTGSR
jgi:hypothetical protein